MTPETNTFIFDFDSTIIELESLDEIIKSSLQNLDEFRKIEIIAQIEKITQLGMSGKIDLFESLSQRLKAAKIHKSHIDKFNSKIAQHITPGIPEIINLLQQTKQKIFIISGGFKSSIIPVANKLKIPPENCFGNEFIFDEGGNVIGVDEKNPLCRSDGKTKVITNLKTTEKATGEITIIGDGYTDYVPFEQKVVDHFLGFGVNSYRAQIEDLSKNYFIGTNNLLVFLKKFLEKNNQKTT